MNTIDHTKEPDPFGGRPVQVQVIRTGTPEHAAIIAQELRLPPQGDPAPPAQIAIQPARSRRRRARTREPQPTCDRHGRKCAICADPYRDEIEELFLDWRRPSEIAEELGLHLRTLYRHAHATGLYAKRQGRLRTVLDRILESVDNASVSGDCIIRAVRAYSCLGRDNRWTEPPTRLIHSYEAQLASANAPIEIAPKRKRVAVSARRQRSKKRVRKSRRLIDTKAIRK
jgi:hypothetical protein